MKQSETLHSEVAMVDMEVVMKMEVVVVPMVTTEDPQELAVTKTP